MFCEYVVMNIRFKILSYVESVGCSKEEYLQAIGEYAQNIHMESEEVFEYFVKMLQIAIEIRDKDSDSRRQHSSKSTGIYSESLHRRVADTWKCGM